MDSSKSIESAGCDIPVVRPGQGGALCINESKWDAQWWWQAFLGVSAGGGAEPVAPFTLPADGTQRAILDLPASGKHRGDAEVAALVAKAPLKDTAVIPFNQSTNTELSNKPIAARLVFGASANAPGIVPEPIHIAAPGQFVMKTSNGGAQGSVFMAAAMRRFMRKAQESRFAAFSNRKRSSFWLAPDDAPQFTMAPADVLDVPMTVPSWGVFQALTCLDDSESTTGLLPRLLVQILDPRTRTELLDQPLPWLEMVAAHTAVLSPTGEIWTAAAFEGPMCPFSHLFEKLNEVIFQFTSVDAGTITLRPGVRGVIYKVEDDGDDDAGSCPPDSSDLRAAFASRGRRG